MHWKDMPQYCRYRQKPDHCRADCPELLVPKQCHNCNEPGHLARQCHRNNVRTDQSADKKVQINQFKTRKSGSTRHPPPLPVKQLPHLPTPTRRALMLPRVHPWIFSMINLRRIQLCLQQVPPHLSPITGWI